MRGDRQALAAGIAASLLLHLAWILSATRPPASPAERTSHEPIELTIETSRSAPAAAHPKLSKPPQQPTPEPRARAPRTRPDPHESAARPTPREHSAEAANEVRVPQPTADQRAARPNGPSDARPAAPTDQRLDLTPRAAAASLEVAQASDHGRLCTPRGKTAAERCEDELSLPPAQGVQDELNRSLRASAKFHDYLTKREPPALKRASDGSYSFTGLVFHAQIAPDGQVTFADAPVVRSGPIPIAGGFDISDAVEKYLLGKEIYSAEKRWFLDQTAELREQLAAAGRASEDARAKREVERALERIVDSAQSPREKRDAVFALWEDCGDDADSAAIRRVVEDFVRRRMPQASDLGFSPNELQEKNRTRPPHFRFDPYGAS